jgi:IS30 family transposase
MTRHVQFTVDTGVAIYFCDLNSPAIPTARGSAAATRTRTGYCARTPPNAPICPLTPKQTSTRSPRTQRAPRQTLAFMTPSEKDAESVAMTP